MCKTGGREDRTGEVSEEVRSDQSWRRAVVVELEKTWVLDVTGRAQKQLIDVTEKNKGGLDNFRAHAQVVGRLGLPFRRH